MTKNSKKDTSILKTGRKLRLTRDTSIESAELWMSIYVAGPPQDQVGFPEMFARARCTKANTVDEADLVVFAGGDDVDPALYGAKTHSTTNFDPARDEADLALYAECYEKGIPMMGVCRGAQFGWTMLGGQLYQDVDNHYKAHFIYTDAPTKRCITASSVHHQMIKWDDNLGADILAWCFESRKRSLDDDTHTIGPAHKDVEAFWHRDNCFFGVQGHPEYKGYLPFTQWCLESIEHLIIHNPDIMLKNRVYRIKPSVLETRNNRMTIVEEKKETA